MLKQFGSLLDKWLLVGPQCETLNLVLVASTVYFYLFFHKCYLKEGQYNSKENLSVLYVQVLYVSYFCKHSQFSEQILK